VPRKITQAEWDSRALERGLEWCEPVAGADVKTRARCREYGHEWEARPSSVYAGKGCPECARTGRYIGQDEWVRRFAAEGKSLLGKVNHSTEKVAVRCDYCGHEWAARPNSVAEGRGGCPECNLERQRVPQSTWEQRFEAQGLELLGEVRSTHSLVSARCRACGNTWKVDPGAVGQGHSCRDCAFERQKVSQADWESRAARNGLHLLEAVRGSERSVRVRSVDCGHEWKVLASHVGTTGCARCAKKGFNPSKPAYLYLIAKDDGTAKVGITGVAKMYAARMNIHKANGYHHVHRWLLEPGTLAQQIEKETITRWREKDGLSPVAPKGEDGYRETVNTALLPIQEIIGRVLLWGN